ncbi:MAG: glycosyltransferase family 2 protein [Proteobacteria bacterium]|nr:glycosyltransferase family 2 protein [Pseudomonadota bacterium]MBS0573046.1 glycosyltransferase family 2 protein [Pseudomonadota bacterium]
MQPEMQPGHAGSPIGAVIVTFNAAEVIGECLDSLMAQAGTAPWVVVVDNASSDGTVAALRAWGAARPGMLAEAESVGGAAALAGAARVALLHSGVNRGFAGGVNLGLSVLVRVPGIAHFWVLNPDAFADAGAAVAILKAAAAQPGYGIIGGRVCYAEPPQRIQIDGGTINRWTGVTGNINLGAEAAAAPLPEAAAVDFVTGANLVASRRFYEAVGPMREDYFLYYEEADWALRRDGLPIVIAPGFTVYHHAGTAIGSPTLERIASPFSFWFKYRSRMLFLRRFNPAALPVAAAYATVKALQLMLRGAFPQALTLLRAVYGLPAPRAVRERLSPEARRIAFGR